MVITENAVTSNHYFYRKEDIEMARFTAIPYAFIDRRDWNDIRRGVSYAETEMQVGESKRRVPFLTNSSKFRNDILKNNIYHHFDLQGITSIGSTTDNDEDYDGEYEDGLESNQVVLLENI
jgi:hypothetical protein